MEGDAQAEALRDAVRHPDHMFRNLRPESPVGRGAEKRQPPLEVSLGDVLEAKMGLERAPIVAGRPQKGGGPEGAEGFEVLRPAPFRDLAVEHRAEKIVRPDGIIETVYEPPDAVFVQWRFLGLCHDASVARVRVLDDRGAPVAGAPPHDDTERVEFTLAEAWHAADSRRRSAP